MSEEMKELNMLKADPPGHVARKEWLNLARVRAKNVFYIITLSSTYHTS